MVDVVITGQKCKLEILDTAGADSYIHLRDGWIRSNKGFILVYSISSKSSFIRIQGLYDEIQKVKKSSHPYTSSQVPIIIVGSKADIAKREVSLLEGKEMARILGYRFFESSAKDGGNIEKSFYTIMRQLQKLRKEKTLLDNLIDLLPQWYNLVRNLESEISLLQIELAKANTSALAPVYAMNIATEQLGAKKLPTLQRFHVKLPTLHLPHLL
jgi:small GTP-binding protein